MGLYNRCMQGYPKDLEARRERFRATHEERFKAKAERLYPEYVRLVNETTLSRREIARTLRVCMVKMLPRLEKHWGVVWPATPQRPTIGPKEGAEKNGNG